MTEIVQNNNSMKFDLLETGNSSSSGPDSDNLFNNLLGSVDIENTDVNKIIKCLLMKSYTLIRIFMKY